MFYPSLNSTILTSLFGLSDLYPLKAIYYRPYHYLLHVLTHTLVSLVRGIRLAEISCVLFESSVFTVFAPNASD